MLRDKKIDSYLSGTDPLNDQILSSSFKKINTELKSIDLNFLAKISLKALFKESFRLRRRYNKYISKKKS